MMTDDVMGIDNDTGYIYKRFLCTCNLTGDYGGEPRFGVGTIGCKFDSRSSNFTSISLILGGGWDIVRSKEVSKLSPKSVISVLSGGDEFTQLWIKDKSRWGTKNPLGNLHVGTILSQTCDREENELLMSFPFNHPTATELSTKQVILRNFK